MNVHNLHQNCVMSPKRRTYDNCRLVEIVLMIFNRLRKANNNDTREKVKTQSLWRHFRINLNKTDQSQSTKFDSRFIDFDF